MQIGKRRPTGPTPNGEMKEEEKGEIYTANPPSKPGGRTRKRTREDLIQLRPDLCSCDLGGKDDANDALPEEGGDGEN